MLACSPRTCSRRDSSSPNPCTMMSAAARISSATTFACAIWLAGLRFLPATFNRNRSAGFPARLALRELLIRCSPCSRLFSAFLFGSPDHRPNDRRAQASHLPRGVAGASCRTCAGVEGAASIVEYGWRQIRHEFAFVVEDSGGTHIPLCRSRRHRKLCIEPLDERPCPSRSFMRTESRPVSITAAWFRARMRAATALAS